MAQTPLDSDPGSSGLAVRALPLLTFYHENRCQFRGMRRGDRRSVTHCSGRPASRARFMKARQLLVYLAILAGPIEGVARANDKEAPSVSKQDLQNKLAYCQQCHGSSARGFRGYYTIPRLAGQQPEYLRNQLQAFVEQRRKSNIMFNVSRVLSPGMIAALAANLHDLNPAPFGEAATDLAADGKKIYDEGLPSSNIPSCAACHGQDAKGNGQFPRLAGQLSDYLSEKLTNWDKERGQDPTDPDSSAPMQPIARGLSQSQIKAVAAYLSSLE